MKKKSKMKIFFDHGEEHRKYLIKYTRFLGRLF